MKDTFQIPTSLARPKNARTRLWQRRTLIGSSGTALGLTGAAYAAYRAAPGFWRNFYSDLSRPVVNPNFTPDPSHWPDTGLHAAWLGHSTVLLKINGFTVLTDPIFSAHAGIHMGVLSVGVKRQVRAALEPQELPKIDLILVSHAHMDHLDVPSLRELENRKTTVVMARHTSDLILPRRYQKVQEAAWGETVRVGPAAITAMEVNHWGARMRVDTYRGYNGYRIEAGGFSILFAGDTANTNAFRAQRRRKPHDLIVMPIGAYNPWLRYHCTPEQAWRMAHDAGFKHFMPVHHQTFPLSQEPFAEPIERLLKTAGSNEEMIVLQQVGEEFHLS